MKNTKVQKVYIDTTLRIPDNSPAISVIKESITEGKKEPTKKRGNEYQ